MRTSQSPVGFVSIVSGLSSGIVSGLVVSAGVLLGCFGTVVKGTLLFVVGGITVVLFGVELLPFGVSSLFAVIKPLSLLTAGAFVC